jgi:hypothetical protein
VQSQAIDELEGLPSEHPFRNNALLSLSNLRSNLEESASLDVEDRELIMRLSKILGLKPRPSRTAFICLSLG